MRRFHSLAVLRESTIWHSCDTSGNWVPEILHQFSQVVSSKLSTQPEHCWFRRLTYEVIQTAPKFDLPQSSEGENTSLEVSLSKHDDTTRSDLPWPPFQECFGEWVGDSFQKGYQFQTPWSSYTFFYLFTNLLHTIHSGKIAWCD